MFHLGRPQGPYKTPVEIHNLSIGEMVGLTQDSFQDQALSQLDYSDE